MLELKDDGTDVHLIGLFFFSSRRRHTRCSRDWSSDVCSSDLAAAPTSPTAWSTRRCASAPRRRSSTSCCARSACKEETSRSEEHTSELQSRLHLVCRLLLEKKKHKHNSLIRPYVGFVDTCLPL